MYISTGGNSKISSVDYAKSLFKNNFQNIELSGGSYDEDFPRKLRELKSLGANLTLHNYIPFSKNSFVLNFNNKIQQEIPNASNQFVDGTAPITSTGFTFSNLTSCTLRDDGLGTLQVVKQANGVLEVVQNDIGTVNYEDGIVNINSFKVAAFEGAAISVTATPANRTVKSDKNIILSYNQTPVINIIQERV